MKTAINFCFSTKRKHVSIASDSEEDRPSSSFESDVSDSEDSISSGTEFQKEGTKKRLRQDGGPPKKKAKIERDEYPWGALIKREHGKFELCISTVNLIIFLKFRSNSQL